MKSHQSVSAANRRRVGLAQNGALLGLRILALLVLAYFLTAALVFDFTQPAFPGDEDNAPDGRPVALGPRPRELFCRPTVHDVSWTGREWPFVAFAPISSLWRDQHGYAPSAEWR